MSETTDQQAMSELAKLARQSGLKVADGKVRRSSSRFCLGVEHGDYNGTELFGVGTDRFIWMAYKPNGTDHIRLLSGNFPKDGLVEFRLGQTPPPKSAQIANSWARFPCGVDFVLRRAGYQFEQGFDAVLFGNIPGGGMSRSASLTLNLMLTFFEVNAVPPPDGLTVVDLAQAVENDYIGSPCGKLDQLMILFAKEGMGTYYDPKNRKISYLPLGAGATDFRIVSLDTGTVRPGLEKSTYRGRRAECEQLAALAKPVFGITCLADVKDEALYQKIMDHFGPKYPNLCERLNYIFHAQQRFYQMLEAWKRGDIETVGRIFRQDGIGLRDDYKISGPELETMCDIARTVPGVLGERMLGGGDKGASGALVRADAVEALKAAVTAAYPRSRPAYADKYAVHVCRFVEGITTLPGL
jgi:galactokinase